MAKHDHANEGDNLPTKMASGEWTPRPVEWALTIREGPHEVTFRGTSADPVLAACDASTAKTTYHDRRRAATGQVATGTA